MSEDTNSKLYSFYRILTMYHKVVINSSSDFLDYIYNMDVLHLNRICSPYIWEDYLFIDDDLINKFKSSIASNPLFKSRQEFDEISPFSEECLLEIIQNGLVSRKEMIHTEHVAIDSIDYFNEHRIVNLWIMNDDEYKSELIKRQRNIKINKLLN